MSTELHAADGRHNHLPRCCCSWDPEAPDTGGPATRCPACPEHGDLAPTVECPQCHQPAGRPHTDYCPLQLREEVFASTCTCDMARSEPLDRRPGQHHMPGCPMRIDPLGQTSQPATRTSQPDTQTRLNNGMVLTDHASRAPGQWLGAPNRETEHRALNIGWHPISTCRPEWCGATPADGDTPLSEPTALATPTPGLCPGCFHTAHPGSECRSCYHRA